MDSNKYPSFLEYQADVQPVLGKEDSQRRILDPVNITLLCRFPLTVSPSIKTSSAVEDNQPQFVNNRTGHRLSEMHASSEYGKDYENKYNPIMDKQSHKDKSLISRSECKRSFAVKSSLEKNHLEKHQGMETGENIFSCPECGKCFKQKHNLEIHLRIHTGVKPYLCSDCKKCFSTKSNLNKHLRIHKGEKKFSCPELKHLRTHTGEKPFSCPECEKWFRSKEQLEIHLRIHTGEKPYSCSECEKCFTKKSNLDAHLRIHTGFKSYNYQTSISILSRSVK
ncbi:gastrula zinc finger protein XlCGF8.2DB-like [Bufo gargarizans]|uniref:gastrula zinc finger protein XlCGF8.2DB-like n=1 Tax=Bufo gargarizans TaxID=30331 RepID=UPI001CF3D53A|nr:gastrula zinc finger protein XlCGF8.2DB-like [Bufo gargarizans]